MRVLLLRLEFAGDCVLSLVEMPIIRSRKQPTAPVELHEKMRPEAGAI